MAQWQKTKQKNNNSTRVREIVCSNPGLDSHPPPPPTISLFDHPLSAFPYRLSLNNSLFHNLLHPSRPLSLSPPRLLSITLSPYPLFSPSPPLPMFLPLSPVSVCHLCISPSDCCSILQAEKLDYSDSFFLFFFLSFRSHIPKPSFFLLFCLIGGGIGGGVLGGGWGRGSVCFRVCAVQK